MAHAACCSSVFGASASITRLLASPVAALTARVQAAEGDFRAVHAALLQASEATALCSDGAVEGMCAAPRGLRVIAVGPVRTDISG